ncbi:hypothetical protein PFICI_02011 [Pestalotiopsis fici W106-1]|uniref:Uncharacterized protein n=1 Tax=Pestalotiopsis fici (strain W106-1 / CGMCC3.15140) TaxID=1229662 RepID=W3XQ58_PESFW|nr:uncharacterized protein PFICI_02011 [Pestalotiopsis fici W106-1]ETS88183.1 hypothetical protein PFICI_02011 [Pestalotiopsis fici W106-1]
MSEEGRRVSTTPIPVPVPFYAQQAMAQPTPSPLSAPRVPVMENPTATTATTENNTTTSAVAKDVAMTDAEPTSAASPALQQGASPAPNRTGTPARATNGVQEHQQQTSTSRAASAHPDPGFTMQSEAPLHGAPARQYLNTKVTGVLLDGMKLVAKEQPKDPLRVLGEFLLQRSKELENQS